MGRCKKTPRRKQEIQDDDWSGRKALPGLSSIDLLLAEEVLVPDRIQVEEELEQLVDTDDEEENFKKKKKKTKRVIVRKKHNRKKNRKHVQFSTPESVSIPPLELEILQDDSSDEPVFLRYNGTLNEIDQEKQEILLSETTRDIAVALPYESVDTTRLPVSTPHGIVVACQIVCPQASRTIREAMTAAVLHEKTMGIALVRRGDVWHFQFYLCPAAFPLCHPSFVPVHASTMAWRSKRLRPVVDLRMVLETIFSIDVAPTNHSAMPPSAKQVYSFTDNVQLTAAMKNEPHEPLSIPGLVLTLRPYQEHAVRWMLQRERGTGVVGEEWKLAWLVLSDSSTEAMSLTQWKGSENVLLYCPFMGWLAQSIQEARTMSVAPFSITRGGILAESMGLGKTVEVLACILANPRPLEDYSQPNQTSLAKRKLVFDDDSSGEMCTSAIKTEPDRVDNEANDAKKRKVGIVEDIVDFAEVEDESDENSESSDKVKPLPVASTYADVSGVSEQDSRARFTVVTPDLTKAKAAEEERWLDDDTVGSCICSRLICFSNSHNMLSKAQPIVLCRSCEEPMHLLCASFDTENEMRRQTKALNLRQRFTNLTIECGLCDEHFCPSCLFASKTKFKSAATLIVTPAAIMNQWTREIKRHALKEHGKNLNVLIYEGINRVSKMQSARKSDASIKFLHPKTLAEADIVLMTFDALMTDLGHSDENKFIASREEESSFVSQCNLRRRKRYRVVPSPLQSIEWWRVCLDEAQRVETPTAASARMALKLDATNRWCVSGTPIGRGKLEDLFGLLLFLRVEPFCHKAWFTKCFSSSSPQWNIGDRIEYLLRHVFWRSTKALECVREQMGVPEQVESRVVLHFSSIEKHFYERQLEEILATIGDVAERAKAGRKRKAVQIQLLADRLHRLRAACCHPQVGSSGLSHSAKRRCAGFTGQESEKGLASRVMTMSQILDRFIDDARQKCEESQRLAILHTNGMAAISRLKVEAKARGVDVKESNAQLLRESCRLYQESLDLGEENARPSLTTGEAFLTGCTGFRNTQRQLRNGSFVADWEVSTYPNELWTRVDFSATRNLIQMRLRPITRIPQEVLNETSQNFTWQCLLPREVVLQVSSAAVGGEFVDVASLVLPLSNRSETPSWETAGGFRTNKSKSWRVMIRSFYADGGKSPSALDANTLSRGIYAGLEVELYEADIANDSLQRLHCLHNASVSLGMLLDLKHDEDPVDIIKEKIAKMKIEEEKIESLYMDVLRSVHAECNRRLREENHERKKLESELRRIGPSTRTKSMKDCWEDNWWDDFLVLLRLHGNEQEQKAFCEKIAQDMDGYLRTTVDTTNSDGIIAFPEFSDINGFRVALNSRIERIRDGIGGKSNRTSRRAQEAILEDTSPNVLTNKVLRFRCPVGGHNKCMQSILRLSDSPNDEERFENSHCSVCKADWLQTGPKCHHCKIGEDLEELAPDRVTLLVMTSLHSMIKGPFGMSFLKKSTDTGISERARLFGEVMEAERRERAAAWRMWRTHLDLLNDLDELGQCKSSMRLSYEGEDLTTLRDDQLNAIVIPVDVHARYYDHAAKAAMFMGDLRRAKDTLRFLKNQSMEEGQQGNNENEEDRCVLCLSGFGSERAVLRCGHSYHLSPCLEDLKARSRLIVCPMRCRIRTDPNEVMIATSKRADDGSRSLRAVKGSWGTKVTRLVADVLDIRDKGEKGVVFSQWEDMLDIVQQAMMENGVSFARATSMRQIGSSSETFLRDRDCTLLLLNVKNGAEGLTLLEATHVFMVEPLLNCGLDSQAINRVHRIGQNKKTYVHRYLIEDTIEMKIDKLRAEHQEEDQLEDSINESKKPGTIRAGGIDGGFRSEQELLSVLQP